MIQSFVTYSSNTCLPIYNKQIKSFPKALISFIISVFAENGNWLDRCLPSSCNRNQMWNDVFESNRPQSLIECNWRRLSGWRKRGSPNRRGPQRDGKRLGLTWKRGSTCGGINSGKGFLWYFLYLLFLFQQRCKITKTQINVMQVVIAVIVVIQSHGRTNNDRFKCSFITSNKIFKIRNHNRT